ncbi:MAG: hypothetical protein U1U88_002285 [Lawsonella clevelandensis]
MQRPLIPYHPEALDRWVVHVPASQVAVLQDAVFSAGGGALGDYTQCSFRVDGTGQFLPMRGLTPIWERQASWQQVSRVPYRVRSRASPAAEIQEAVTTAHPYEEPSYRHPGKLRSGTWQ